MKKIKVMLFVSICLFAFGICNVNAEDITNYGILVNGTQLTSKTKSIEAGSGTISYDAEDGILTLNNATIEGEVADTGVIEITNKVAKDVKLVLVGTNKITNTGSGLGILSAKNLTITGDSLEIKSASSTIGMSAGNLIIDGAKLSLTTTEDSGRAIYANADVKLINNANLTTTSSSFGIYAVNLTIDNSLAKFSFNEYTYSVFLTGELAIENLQNKAVYGWVFSEDDKTKVDLTNENLQEDYLCFEVVPTYTVKVENDANSVVELSTDVVRSGETVDVVISAKENYKLVSVLANGKDLKLNDGKATITITEDTIIKVESIAKDDVAIVAPTLDTTKEVEEVSVGVKTDSETDAILKDALNEKENINVEEVADIEIVISNSEAAVVSREAAARISTLIEEKEMVFATYFDITLNVNKLNGVLVDTLSELNKELTFQVALPSDLINTDKNIKRTYYVIRYHDNTADVLNTSVSSNVLTFSSDKFSTFAIAYTDEAVKQVVNPNTSDNVLTYVITSIVCLAGIFVIAIAYKKRFN